MPVRAAEVIAQSVSDFMAAWPRLLATDVVYKIAAYVVLTPLMGLVLRLFLETSGSSVVADQDILYFFLSPMGLVSLVAAGAAGLAILSLETACLMAIGFGEIRGHNVKTVAALWYGLRHAWVILRLTANITVRVLLIAAPFLATAGLLYWLLLGSHDINYYLADRPPVFLVTAGLVGAILLTMAVLVIRRLISWSFALPLVLFEGLAPRASMSESHRRVKGHLRTVAVVLVGWGAATTLLSALPLAMASPIARAVVPPFSGNMGALLFVVGAVLLLWGGLNLLVSVITFSLFALFTVRLYQRLGSSEEAQGLKGRQVARAQATTRRPVSRKTILAALLVAVAAASAVGFVFMDQIRMDDDVVVIAHRGAAGRAPENTLASVVAAIQDGTNFVEIDVQETADGRVIVIHDADFMRVGGVALNVWDGTLEEIGQIDIGSWFGPEFSDQRPPTLEEVLELCLDRAQVVIELKFYGHNQMLEQRVADIVEQTRMADQIITMSLNADVARTMKSLRPDWTVGLLTATAMGDLTTVDADFLAVHSKMASSAFIRRAHAAGKDVYVWTVNDRLNMFRMMTAGVDGLITDEPALARRVIETRAEMSSAERLMVAGALWMGMDFVEPPPENDLN